MSYQIQFLMRKYKLDEDDCNEVLSYVIRKETYGIIPEDAPTAIILGAQPGAGKTELQKEAQYDLRDNAVICNADNFRDLHPLANEIKKKHPEEYAEITAPYAQFWNDKLCLYCQQHKLNLILETTFRSGLILNNTIARLKNAGFKVDIKLLAVSPLISRLGTYLRYEDMVSKVGHGRLVSEEAHNSRFEALPNTLRKVQEAGLYDNLYIYARSIMLSDTNHSDGVTIVANNPKNPLAVYYDELGRLWPEKAKLDFEERCSKVLNLMESRKASIKEIESFKIGVGLRQAPKQSLSKKKGRRL